MRRWRVSVVVLWLVCLWGLSFGLWGCTERQVTLEGTPVTDPVVVTAAQTVALAEALLAAVPPFLIRGHQQGLIPLEVLKAYAEKGLPTAQQALDTARAALTTYAAQPTAEARVHIDVALSVLQVVVLEATLLMQEYGD